MRGTKRPQAKPRRLVQAPAPGKHEQIIRRTANKNAHVITPHGKVQAGRKGRKG